MRKGGGALRNKKMENEFTGAMRSDYFTPSPYHVRRGDTITKLWKALVMDPPPTGLGIKKHLYAAKTPAQMIKLKRVGVKRSSTPVWAFVGSYD